MSSKLSSTDPSIARQVERQMRNWEIARSQHLATTGQAEEKSPVEEFVAISRQVGAEGGRVARLLSEQLGWPVFDREILDVMAGDDKVRRQIYESMDGRDLGWWEETLRSLMQTEFVRNDYFRRLSETILSLARQSRCILVGRGADLLLPPDVGYRVRIVAPLTVRISRLAEHHCLTALEAEEFIARTEVDRRAFFRRHFGVGPDDFSRFDLVINLGRFTCREAAELILESREIRRGSPSN